MSTENPDTVASPQEVLCYNLPPMKEPYLSALQHHLGTDQINVTEKGPNDGTVLSILQEMEGKFQVVEIDRTDKGCQGLKGLQEARRDTNLQIRVIAYGTGAYKDVPQEIDLCQAEPSVIRTMHC